MPPASSALVPLVGLGLKLAGLAFCWSGAALVPLVAPLRALGWPWSASWCPGPELVPLRGWSALVPVLVGPLDVVHGQCELHSWDGLRPPLSPLLGPYCRGILPQ